LAISKLWKIKATAIGATITGSSSADTAKEISVFQSFLTISSEKPPGTVEQLAKSLP
jgi:hypothetical protein